MKLASSLVTCYGDSKPGRSPLVDPRLRTKKDGTVLVPSAGTDWIPTSGPGVAEFNLDDYLAGSGQVSIFPALVTDVTSVDFGFPLFMAHAARVGLAEEVDEFSRRNEILRVAIQRYSRSARSSENIDGNKYDPDLELGLARIIAFNGPADIYSLDSDPVFAALTKSLICRSRGYAGFTPTRERRRALGRLLASSVAPSSYSQNLSARVAGKSTENAWLTHAWEAAKLLRLYESSVGAYSEAWHARRKQP